MSFSSCRHHFWPAWMLRRQRPPDISIKLAHRACPITTRCKRAGTSTGSRLAHHSLDNLVGTGEDRRRDRQAERLRGLEVDYQLECGWLLHRQVGGLFTLEDPPGVNAELVNGSSDARSIGDQATGRGELALHVDRRNRITSRERNKLLAPSEERDDNPAGILLNERRERAVDLGFGARPQDMEPQALRLRRVLHLCYEAPSIRIVRVHEQGDYLGLRNHLRKQLKPFGHQLDDHD